MAQPGIPGLDVTEVSGSRAVLDPKRPNFTIPDPPRDFSQGVRSPNLPAVDNRPNFTMPRGPGPESLSTGARQAFDVEAAGPSRVQQGLRAVRQAGATALDAIPGSLRTVGRLIGKAAGPLAAAPAVYDAMAPDSTARYAKRFGVSEPTGDGSVGDIAKFAGLRAGGFASDLGNAMTMGLAGKLYADNQPGAMPTPTQPNVPAAPPVGPNPTDLRLAAGTQTAPPITAPDTRSAIRGVPTTETLGFDGYSKMLNNIRSLGPTSDATSGGAIIPNSRAGGKPSAWYEQLGLSRTDLLGLRPRDLRHLQGLAMERANATLRADTDTNIAGLREQGEMSRANLSANTQRLINERQVEMGLRGQDITREGHMISAQGQRARLMYDMGKDQRDFAAGRSDADFTQGQAAQKQMHETVAGMLPPTMIDGKPQPDTATAARYMTGVNATVSKRMEELRQHLALNPNDKTAAGELEGLSRRGVAQLPPDEVRKIVMGMRAAEIAQSTHTGPLTPWGSTAKASTAPIRSLREDGSGNYVSDRGDVIPRRYIDKQGSTLGIGGQVTTDFDILKGMRQ